MQYYALIHKDISNQYYNKIEVMKMLWTIVAILIILWLLGFINAVGGPLVHLLLVIALIVIIVNLIQGKKIL